MIKITFPDGNVKEFAKGTTAYQIAESISPRLAADSLALSGYFFLGIAKSSSPIATFKSTLSSVIDCPRR